jgi:predicted cupin superfamily sugar epimerase
MLTPELLIERLGLTPLPVEGGHFRQTWLSSDALRADGLPERYGRAKPAGTAIYYLLTSDRDSFSALHRLPTDEVYHFYLGDPVEMLLLHPGGASDVVTLGSDVLAGQRVQFVVPRGAWQGSRLVARAALRVDGDDDGARLRRGLRGWRTRRPDPEPSGPGRAHPALTRAAG